MPSCHLRYTEPYLSPIDVDTDKALENHKNAVKQTLSSRVQFNARRSNRSELANQRIERMLCLRQVSRAEQIQMVENMVKVVEFLTHRITDI